MCHKTNPRLIRDIYQFDLQIWVKVIADIAKARSPMDCIYGANHVPVCEISDKIKPFPYNNGKVNVGP